MKKIIRILAVVSLVACFFTGCGANKSTSNGGTVATDGSTSMEKVIGYLSFFNKNPPMITFLS